MAPFILASTLAQAANINYLSKVGPNSGNPNEALQINNFASSKGRLEFINQSAVLVAPTTVSGIFSLLEDDATPQFHFGGTARCGVNSDQACLGLDIPIRIVFSSDLSILVDQILFSFDATFFPTSPALQLQCLHQHHAVRFDAGNLPCQQQPWYPTPKRERRGFRTHFAPDGADGRAGAGESNHH